MSYKAIGNNVDTFARHGHSLKVSNESLSSSIRQWRPYIGAKGAFARPVFILLFQPKVFHCLLENLTKKNTLPLMGFLNFGPSEF